MIDIETRKIIDIIESRDYAEVKEWLKSFPNLEIVSRDGSVVYKKAIADSHKNVKQISDRFHLLKNLTNYCRDYIKRSFSNKVEIEKIEIQSIRENFKLKEKYKFKTKWELIEKVHELRKENYIINDISKILEVGNKTVIKYLKILPEEKKKYQRLKNDKFKSLEVKKRKEELIKTAKKLFNDGKSKRSIAQHMNLNRKTVTKYIKSSGIWEKNNDRKRISKLDKYKTTIKIMYKEGITSRTIYERIKEKGYSGSSSLLRTFLSNLITELKETDEKYIINYVERKTLISLLYNPVSKIKDITEENLNKIFEKYENFKTIIDIVLDFKKVLFEKKADNLDTWIKKIKQLNIREINSFITGINRDIDAVKNAITYEYSNGLAEGKINKIKVIKRIMYGRCNFKTLKNKILLQEGI